MVPESSQKQTSQEATKSSPDIVVRVAVLQNMLSALESNDFTLQWHKDHEMQLAQGGERATEVFNALYHVKEYLKTAIRRAKR